MNRVRVVSVTTALFLALVLVLSTAGSALAFWPMGQTPSQAPGSQVGSGWGCGGYGGGMMGGGMMGGYGQTQPGQVIGLDNAIEAVRAYVSRTGNADLVLDEVMEFEYNFYAIVKEKSTGTGAFELLVSDYGAVYPEMGPNMMWNTKYGMMAGYGGGMMGGGMMGGWYGARTPSGPMTVSADQARQTAQQWLDRYQPGSGTEEPDRFYGYYTVHTLKDGKVSGMLSVNGYTGAVWYHSWHGNFVQLRELAG